MERVIQHIVSIGYRRIMVMAVGIVILGLGISLFKLSALGNDPSSAMVMAIGDHIGVDFARTLLAANCIWFLAELKWGRHYIGLGTVVNWFGVGSISMVFTNLINRTGFVPENLPQRLAVTAAALLVLSLAASMYQTADVGIAPYDSLSLMLRDRLPVKYFWCRIFTDVICVALCLMFGGLVGLGTVICSLGLGPFIHFFDRHVSEKLVG